MLRALATASALLPAFVAPLAFGFEGARALSDKQGVVHPLWVSVQERQTLPSQPRNAAKPRASTLEAVFASTASYRYISDYTLHGAKDYWQTPKETHQNKGGDCEDYAISWYYEARARGFPPEHMNIVIGDIPARGYEQHAVLVVTVEGEKYVLDSLKSAPTHINAYEQKDFRAYYRFNEQGFDLE